MPLQSHSDGQFGLLLNSPGTAGTSIILNTGQGQRFIDPAATNPSTGAAYGSYVAFLRPNDSTPSVLQVGKNTELVLVTARSSDTFTVTRNYDGTGTVNAVAGYQLFVGPSNQALNEIENRLAPLWVPATAFTGNGATLANRYAAATGYAMPGWALNDGGVRAADYVNALIKLPAGFVGKTVTDTCWIGVATGNGGNWQSAQLMGFMAAAQQLDKTADVSRVPSVIYHGPGAQYYFFPVAPGTFTPTTTLLRYAFGRIGSSGADTLPGDIWFMGVELSIP